MPEDTSFDVGVGVRIVPAGVTTIGEKQFIRAAVVLSPIAASEALTFCGTTVDIRHWPTEIEKMLRGADKDDLAAGGGSVLKTLFSPVKKEQTTTPIGCETGAIPGNAFRAMLHDMRRVSGKTIAFKTWSEQRGKDIAQIDGMWCRLVAQERDEDWKRIIEALKASGAENTIKKYRPPAANNEKLAPDIRGIGRGQAALLLSLERGRSLLTRIRRSLDGSGCSGRDDECNLATPIVPRLPSYLTESERVRAIGVTRLSDEEAEAKRVYEQMTPADRTRRDEELADLRAKNAQNAQADIKKQQTRINEATDKDARAAAYRHLLACTRERLGVPECMMAAAAKDAQALSDAVEDSLGRHKDAVHEDDQIRKEDDTADPNARKKDYDDRQEAKAPQMRLAALQNQPSLARVFNLVVDVLIELPHDVISDATAVFGERGGASGRARFGFLTAALDCLGAERRVWTTCKVKLKTDAGNLADDIWPCTRAELDLFWALSDAPAERDALICQGALTQIDGFLNLSAARPLQDDVREPRFDIISLDAPLALENRETLKSGAKEGRPPLLTQRTAGLAVIDRWRETSALIQALNSLNRNVANTIVDADDLTIGYRMDVGVRSATAMTWRSLCSRYIQFGDQDNCIETLLAQIVPDPADRLAYDSAIVVMPVMVKDRAGGGKDQKIAFVEDTVGHWTGPPIGVDTNSLTIDLAKSSAALQLGHLYSLSPDPDKPQSLPKALRIPRQVFGGGYFFKLAPRYHGGVIRRADTSASSAAVEQDAFAVLPSTKTGARRFLRHERVEAPIVTTPQPILARLFDDATDGLRETATNIVVRSKAKKPKEFEPNDKGIKSSYRVVVPPSVPADFAERHGVFAETKMQSYRDCDDKRWEGPADGLNGIDYDQRAGGFPVYGFSATSSGGQEAVTNPQTKPSGDAVFRPRQQKAERREAYYPDPAASFMVIALRDLAGRLLPGKPLVVPVSPSGVAFPQVRPVAIEVVARSERSGRSASHERILGLYAAKGKHLLRGDVCLTNKGAIPGVVQLDGSATIGSGSVAASRVDVALEPGESFEIDIWCVPTVDQLTAWFDAVESAALVASVNPETGKACMTCPDFATQLKLLQLDSIAEMARKLGRSGAAANQTICSSGQAAMPAGALRCVAEAAHQLLLTRPTPELAARTTMTATHAIPQVYDKPEILLKLTREPAPPPRPGGPAPAKPPPPTVVVSGYVNVDRPTTGLFEIRAEAASLVSCTFDDDQRRSRTPDEVARGIWPRSPVSDAHMTVRDVYGFEVAADGSVTLPCEQATLVRVEDDIAEPKVDAPAREARDLADLRVMSSRTTDANGNPGSGNIPHVSAPFKITDARARIIRLWAIAGSRTAACFRDSKGDILDIADARIESNRQEIVLQATEAPAKVAPLTILPAFYPEQTDAFDKSKHVFTVKRRVKLRIRMRRPWFTSGEGERLGIILWPPDIMKGRVTASQDSVWRDYDVATDENAEIVMSRFKDEEIGPGGAFITRWGLDPTKEGGKLGWITPPSAFADLATAETDPGVGSRVLKAEKMYVPRASIPIPIDDGVGPRRRTWLEASLLTFVPKFDIDHESWFCDVELRADSAPDPFMRLGLVRYQPHAPPELRVSEPVVEWLQIPQHRAVTVTIDKDEPRQVLVEMQGTNFVARKQDAVAEDVTDIKTWTKQPVMKVSMFRRRADGIETVADLDPTVAAAGFSRKAERTWLPQTQAEWNHALSLPDVTLEARPHPAVKAKQSDDGAHLSWLARFVLDDAPLAPKKNGTVYRVLVEEVQPMLPATYDDEPHDPGVEPPPDRVQLTASGPRFAVLLDIEQPVQPPPPPFRKKVRKIVRKKVYRQSIPPQEQVL